MSSTSLLKMIKEIQNTNDLIKIESLSEEVSERLSKEDSINISGIVYSLIKQTNLLKDSSHINDILEDEYSSLRIRKYLDEDQKYKVAVGIAYIQDFNNIEYNLDKEILEILVKKINDSGLMFIINDITVNEIQWRN